MLLLETGSQQGMLEAKVFSELLDLDELNELITCLLSLQLMAMAMTL